MERRRQPKTGAEMQQMRKKRNLALVGVIAGLVVLFNSLSRVLLTPAPTSSSNTNFASTIIVLPSSSNVF